MATLVHFEKARIDKVAAHDDDRPILTQVYVDLVRQVMYATDGYMMAINRVQVDRDEDDDVPEVVGIPHKAMSYLLSCRGPKLTFGMRMVDGLVVVWCGERQIAVSPPEKPPPIAEVALTVAEMELEAVACFDARRLAKLADAMGETYLAVGYSEPSAPLLIAVNGSAGVLMPWFSDNKDKWVAQAKELLALPSKEDDDEV